MLPASSRMYAFDYSGGTLSVTFHPELSADDMTVPSTKGMTDDGKAFSNGANVFIIDGRHFLKTMQRIHVNSDVHLIQ